MSQGLDVLEGGYHGPFDKNELAGLGLPHPLHHHFQ